MPTKKNRYEAVETKYVDIHGKIGCTTATELKACLRAEILQIIEQIERDTAPKPPIQTRELCVAIRLLLDVIGL